MADDPGFVHLHVRSTYSLLESALTIGMLAKLAADDGMPALALTDSNNLFGALEFAEKMAATGIQPIMGLRLMVEFGDGESRAMRPGPPAAGRGVLVLLARNREGYAALSALSSRAFLESGHGEGVHAPLSWIAATDRSGLIALTGGADGPLDRALRDGAPDRAQRRLRALVDLFGDDLHVEIQRHGRPDEASREAWLLREAYGRGLPIVATHDCVFARPEDAEAHEVLVRIGVGSHTGEGEGLGGVPGFSPGQHFATRGEMAALFADLPEALATTVDVARRCRFHVRSGKPILPRFTEAGDEAEELRRQASAGLDRRLATRPLAPGRSEADYRARLDFELGVIARMGFPGYFLIVAEFIGWARREGIPVGPGRGSGAGSLVAYALGITDLDPLRFDLLFERFLNPDRVSMPDFDIDFCQDRREEVIRHVQERYGHDRVAQIITFGKFLARGVLRDVGRVLELPYGQVDRLTKMVPVNPAHPVSLAKAIEEEPRLRAAADEDPAVARMLTIAQKLEGLYRHASTHAAGIVIGDRPLGELVPLYRDPRSAMPVTQFNMKWVEPAGLIKFDFLGLKTLSVLRRTEELVRTQGGTLDLEGIPLDDPATFALLARGEAVGIFQLESAGMRRALLDMRPDRFEDIIALVALYRPGPMANIPIYCACKHGERDPEYIHEKVRPVLEETFGVIVYQEQVMQIAQILSGFSLGEADGLRRAMGKKIKAEMDSQRARFVTGCVERGMPTDEAHAIFDMLARFADYGFNKSHAAAYALVAYQTAYAKAHHPEAFLAASMSYELTHVEKLAEFRAEARRLGIPVLPPDVLRSGVGFILEGRAIRYALAAIRGVGVEAAEQIVAARPAADRPRLEDWLEGLPPRLLNRRLLEQLIAAGALDSLNPSRACLHDGVEMMLGHAQAAAEARLSGQRGLFDRSPDALPPLMLPPSPPWSPERRLQAEYEAVGFFMSGHPLDDWSSLLAERGVGHHQALREAGRRAGGQGQLAVVVLDRQERRTRQGQRMGIMTVSDQAGTFEVTAFAETLARDRDLFVPGALLLLRVGIMVDGEEVRFRLESAQPLAAWGGQAAARALRVFVEAETAVPSLATLRAPRGGRVVVVVPASGGHEIEVALPGSFDARPAAIAALRASPGITHVAVQ